MKKLAFILPIFYSLNVMANCPQFSAGNYNCEAKGDIEVLSVKQSTENGAQKYEIGTYVFITDGKARPLVDEGIDLGNTSAACKNGTIEVSLLDLEKQIPGGSLKMVITPTSNGFKIESVAAIPGAATLIETQSTCYK